mmetsp:Transcript_45208/g.70878  ORF Transcript_45208/g.70878 Transcript_45208/m.70878 type:complete len:99 (+) Transcript_45208:140-436(+)
MACCSQPNHAQRAPSRFSAHLPIRGGASSGCQGHVADPELRPAPLNPVIDQSPSPPEGTPLTPPRLRLSQELKRKASKLADNYPTHYGPLNTLEPSSS